jgi:hypothetical protein
MKRRWMPLLPGLLASTLALAARSEQAPSRQPAPQPQITAYGGAMCTPTQQPARIVTTKNGNMVLDTSPGSACTVPGSQQSSAPQQPQGGR